jgi:surface antigen
MRRFALTAMFAATVFSAGCANNQEGGTVLGAVTGGIIGNQFGKGGGKVAATLAGAVVGGIVGNEIGRSLDQRDRELARQAEYDAWESGPPRQPVRWRNPDNGRYGEIVAEDYYYRGPATSCTASGSMVGRSRCAAPPAAIPTAPGRRSPDVPARSASSDLLRPGPRGRGVLILQSALVRVRTWLPTRSRLPSRIIGHSRWAAWRHVA